MKRILIVVLLHVLFVPQMADAKLTQRQVDWLLMTVQEARAVGHEEVVEIAQTVLVLETKAGEWKYDPNGIKGDGGDANGPFQMHIPTAFDVLRWYPYLAKDFAKYGDVITEEIMEHAMLTDIRLNIKFGVHLLIKNRSRLHDRGFRGQELFERTVLSHKFGVGGATNNPDAKKSWYRVRSYEYLNSVVRVFNNRMFRTYTVAQAY